jgi:hypothetical protein
MNSTPSTAYHITNPERFRAAARASKNACLDEPDEMTAIRLTTEIILEYTGETTDTLLKKSGESLETAALWDEAGYEPPYDVQVLVEILHRIHAGI